MVKVELQTLDILLQVGDTLVCLIGVEFKYASHLYLPKADDVFASNLTEEIGFERIKTLVDMLDSLIHIGCQLHLPILIYALLDEYFLKRAIEPCLLCLS